MGRCLDSIYSQGLLAGDFEVICVDDCSTDDTPQVLAGYAARYSNLTVCKHIVNKRQKKGRNTGIKVARGEYVAFIDCDDYYDTGALSRLITELQSYGRLDVLMFDAKIVDSDTYNVIDTCCFGRNSTAMMSGRQFVKIQDFPWAVWYYIYNRDFLLDSDVSFAENVRFEDTDFVIKSIIKAHSIKYVKSAIICHTCNRAQTTLIGNDTSKILDNFKMAERTKLVGIDELKCDRECGERILGIHLFIYKERVKRYLWRLPVRDIFRVLKRYRLHVPCRDRLLAFCARHPVVFGCCVVAGKPFFPLLRKLYLIKRGR